MIDWQAEAVPVAVASLLRRVKNNNKKRTSDIQLRS